jgi:hypothetical protein
MENAGMRTSPGSGRGTLLIDEENRESRKWSEVYKENNLEIELGQSQRPFSTGIASAGMRESGRAGGGLGEGRARSQARESAVVQGRCVTRQAAREGMLIVLTIS